MMLFTTPSYVSPTSGSATMPFILAIAASMLSLLGAEICTCPLPSASSMVIVAPVSSCICWIIFPPGPITAPINSLGMSILTIRGTCGFISLRGSEMVFIISFMICSRPALACIRAFSIISNDSPSHLISICVAVKPSLVPVVLKSMSPRWSSSPRMSLRIAYLSSPGFLINPMAIPDTGLLIGTPASIIARVPPHTLAIDEEPLDSRISLTTRTV